MKVTMEGMHIGTTFDAFARKSCALIIWKGRESNQEYQAACSHAMSKGTIHGIMDQCIISTKPSYTVGTKVRDPLLVLLMAIQTSPCLAIVWQVKSSQYPSASILQGINTTARNRVRDMRRIAKQINQHNAGLVKR